MCPQSMTPEDTQPPKCKRKVVLNTFPFCPKSEWTDTVFSVSTPPPGGLGNKEDSFSTLRKMKTRSRWLPWGQELHENIIKRHSVGMCSRGTMPRHTPRAAPAALSSAAVLALSYTHAISALQADRHGQKTAASLLDRAASASLPVLGSFWTYLHLGPGKWAALLQNPMADIHLPWRHF